MKSNTIIEEFLFEYYSKNLSSKIHLEGGALLSLIFNLDRKFSNDLDFTSEDEASLYNFVKQSELVLKRVSSNRFTTDFKDNRITFQSNNFTFHIDIFIASPDNCEYSKLPYIFKGKKTYILCHSINDVIAEKLCCLLDPNRTELRDLVDLKLIIDEIRYSDSKVQELLRQKLTVKKLNITIDSSLPETIRNKLISKFDISIWNQYSNTLELLICK